MTAPAPPHPVAFPARLGDRNLRGMAGARLLGDGPVCVAVGGDGLDPDLLPTEYQVKGGLALADPREVVGLEIAEFEAAWPAQADPVDPAPLLHALAPLWEARA